MERSTHVLTPATLKALAHPLRLRLLGLLRSDGPATASGLAARLGESSGTTSYHLRQLAAAGFVVDDAELGNGRERWWRSAQDATRLEPADWLDDPELRPAVDSFLNAVLDAHVARARRWLSRTDAPRRWRDAATLSDARLHLSAAELSRLNDEIESLVETYRREPRRGDLPVAVHWQSFPVDGEP
jgi:DNA-binding transcriptional ArsR family regulator